jgi:hypothetical protein
VGWGVFGGLEKDYLLLSAKLYNQLTSLVF